MDTVLVINAGSSSVKFQVFRTDEGGLTRLIKGQMDGIGTRPRLRAEADDRPLIDETYPLERVADVVAMALRLPFATCLMTANAGANTRSIRSAKRSTSAGALPV